MQFHPEYLAKIIIGILLQGYLQNLFSDRAEQNSVKGQPKYGLMFYKCLPKVQQTSAQRVSWEWNQRVKPRQKYIGGQSEICQS